MLPHKHFAIAAAAAAPAAYVLSHINGMYEILRWVLAGGLVSVAVDIDVLVLVMARAGKHDALREFRNPLNIFRRFDSFMNALFYTGLIRTVLLTHAIISVSLIAGFYVYGKELFVPALIGVFTHVASDVPSIIKTVKQRRI